MNQLNLLWELQAHDEILDKLKNELIELKEGKEIEKLEAALNEKKDDLEEKEAKCQTKKVSIEKHTNKLKQINFNIKETNDKLYSGDISNIKQMTTLQEENENYKREANELELEILTLMEQTENFDKEMAIIEKDINNIKENIENKTKYIDENIEAINNKINNEEGIINNLINDIDEKLLKKYNSLKKKKRRPIVGLYEDKCDGCHMSLPTSKISKVKYGKEVSFCDNCGRILHINKMEEKDE